jgi:hypothetical protein
MIPVQLTCESEEIALHERDEDGLGHRPVIRLNGEPLWRGRAEQSAADAERVALAYLRYVLGGAMADPAAAEARFAPREEEAPARPSAAVLGEAVEAIGSEVIGALRKVSAFIENGDWKRFLR